MMTSGVSCMTYLWPFVKVKIESGVRSMDSINIGFSHKSVPFKRVTCINQSTPGHHVTLLLEGYCALVRLSMSDNIALSVLIILSWQ